MRILPHHVDCSCPDGWCFGSMPELRTNCHLAGGRADSSVASSSGFAPTSAGVACLKSGRTGLLIGNSCRCQHRPAPQTIAGTNSSEHHAGRKRRGPGTLEFLAAPLPRDAGHAFQRFQRLAESFTPHPWRTGIAGHDTRRPLGNSRDDVRARNIAAWKGGAARSHLAVDTAPSSERPPHTQSGRHARP